MRARLEEWPRAKPCRQPSFETLAFADRRTLASSGRGRTGERQIRSRLSPALAAPLRQAHRRLLARSPSPFTAP